MSGAGRAAVMETKPEPAEIDGASQAGFLSHNIPRLPHARRQSDIVEHHQRAVVQAWTQLPPRAQGGIAFVTRIDEDEVDATLELREDRGQDLFDETVLHFRWRENLAQIVRGERGQFRRRFYCHEVPARRCGRKVRTGNPGAAA